MFSYYGAKTNIAYIYPRPVHDMIIEPFAGSARYSLLHFEKDVWINDSYKVITDIWEYLIAALPKDILSLPRPKSGESLDDYTFDCEAQKNLMGFLVKQSDCYPGKKVSPKFKNRPNGINYRIEFIANNLFKIKHWKVTNVDYQALPDVDATWFIDPPYQIGGHKYAKSNRHIDFMQLGQWCIGRNGQAIVCEQKGAEWLPFVPITKHRTSKSISTELIWTNRKISPMGDQKTMFET